MAEMNTYLQDQDVKDFTREIQQHHLGPLWEAIPAIMNKTPEPHAQAYLWSDELLKKKLWEAAEIFTPDRGGERRAIYFQNPGLTYRQALGLGFYNTNTLCSGSVTATRGSSSITSALAKCASIYFRRRRCIHHC